MAVGGVFRTSWAAPFGGHLRGDSWFIQLIGGLLGCPTSSSTWPWSTTTARPWSASGIGRASRHRWCSRSAALLSAPGRSGGVTCALRLERVGRLSSARMTDRPDHSDPDWRPATLAVHAGLAPDELTGAVAPPIYQTATFAQDGVGRPRGGWEYARTGNPDARPAGSRDRGARGRHARARVRERLCDHPGDRGPGTPRRADPVRGRRLRRHVPLLRARAARHGRRGELPRLCPRPDRRAGPQPRRTHAPGVAGDADQPAPAHRRHRGDRRAHFAATWARAASDRCWWSTTRSPLPFRSGRWSWAPTSPTTRRPSTWAATPTRSAASSPRRATTCSSASSSCRTPSARCPGRSTASSCCAACARWRCAWSATRPTPEPWRRHSPQRDDVEKLNYPGLASGPFAHPQAALAARQMRYCTGMVSFVPAGARRPLA